MLSISEDWTQNEITHEYLMNKIPVNAKESKFCVKMGSEGSMYFDKELQVKCPALTETHPHIMQEYEIMDTTGAGDAFFSAFVFNYVKMSLNDMSKKEKETAIYNCLFSCNKCGFLTITQRGAQSSPNIPELELFEQEINQNL